MESWEKLLERGGAGGLKDLYGLTQLVKLNPLPFPGEERGRGFRAPKARDKVSTKLGNLFRQ